MSNKPSIADHLTSGIKQRKKNNIGVYVTDDVNNFLLYSKESMVMQESTRNLELMDQGLQVREDNNYSKAGEAQKAIVAMVEFAKQQDCKTVDDITQRIRDALELLSHVEEKMKADSSEKVIENLDKVSVK